MSDRRAFYLRRRAERRFRVAAIVASATLFAAGAAIWKQPTPIIVQLPATR
jgi:hypothetical protein